MANKMSPYPRKQASEQQWKTISRTNGKLGRPLYNSYKKSQDSLGQTVCIATLFMTT
jgi:hypothetical protein